MLKKISKYIISLILCLVILPIQAQKKGKHIEQKTDSVKVNLYNGFTVYGDIASVASSLFSKGTTYSYESALQVDLLHKYYPIFELGLAGANKLSNDNIGFKTNALFGRLGIDFNLQKKKKDSKPTNNMFQAGLRLGMSNFRYNITNVVITDNYWGGTEAIPYNNISTTKMWFEVVVGVRVEIAKNIYMGWSVRNKNLLSKDIINSPNPWYIPGFGINSGSSNWAINYVLGYHF